MKDALKAYKWWEYKPPLMLAIGYFQLLRVPSPPGVGTLIVHVGLFLVAIIGIAGFGHLLNDLYDQDSDRHAGLPNTAARWGRVRVGILFAALLTLSVVPWLWLPKDSYIIALICAEFVLFIAYSVPPVRLKGRGLWGAATDALYGYTIPVLVSSLVFMRLSHGPAAPTLLVLLGTWTFVLGVRWIVLHQLQELGRDQRAGIGTFCVRRGFASTLRLISRQVLAAEALLFVPVLLVMGMRAIIVPLGFVVYVALEAMLWRRQWVGITTSAAGQSIARVMVGGVRMMSQFQTDLLPLLVLVTLSVRHHAFTVLLGLHLLVFQAGSRRALQSLAGLARAGRVRDRIAY